MTRTKKPRAKKKRVRLSPAEASRRRMELKFKTDIRTVFLNAGFEQVPTRDKNITVASRVGDLDSVFLYNNIVVIVEDTTLATSNIGDHLRKKAEFFSHLQMHRLSTLEVLRGNFERFAEYFNRSDFEPEEYHLRFVYASRNDVDESYQTHYGQACKLLSYSSLQYFLSLTKTIKRSARFEILKFLDVDLHQVGSPKSKTDLSTFSALQLPAVQSGFPPGHKLVSFLIDPATLLERAYVLRADSWRDSDALYQRLLVRDKIGSMRKYLVEERRVFVNNIIVTLRGDAVYHPTPGSKPEDSGATHVSVGELTIPRRFDAIGIIDGQHRVYAYHEGDDQLDTKIAALRGRQHLLVTGIIYPNSISSAEAEVFEAKLFLEINDKQKRVRGDLKQAIETLINPCSDVAIAKSVLHRLGATGPLVGILGLHFFDTGKLKTTSIVSYGLRHIVGLREPVSFFNRWTRPDKGKLLNVCDRDVLDLYVQYCGTELNKLIGAFKASRPQELWTTDRRESRMLTTTTINGLIFCMRLLLGNQRLGSFDSYLDGFRRLDVDFRPGKFPYKSSHWRKLGEHIYDQCFKP